MQKKGIVAVSLVAGLVAVTIMALVTRIFMARAKSTTTDSKRTTDGQVEQAQRLALVSSSWKRLLLPKQEQSKSHWVPSFSNVIKAGEEGLFTSTLFTTLPGYPREQLLESLYDAFAHELRSRPAAERSSYPGDITKFLAQTKRPAASLARSKSVSHIRRADTTPKTHRKSLDLSVMEMGLARGLSVKKPAAVLVSMRNGLQDAGHHKAEQLPWMKDGQTAKHQGGKMTVKVTPAELAMLSILLGSQVRSDDTAQEAPSETGAYSISLVLKTSETAKLPHKITLQQHKFSKSQRHASGSGVSPLFAKHLFCGSLPYSQDKLGVHSILLDDETFEAIQAGASLYTHPYIARTPQSKHLESLPGARSPRFHILATSTEPHPSTTLLDAIAALPFSGGLAPLAAAPLIKTVRFVARAGLSPARLLQRLEGLVDKVHRHSPHLNIFGPLYEPQHAGLLYRERERLGKLDVSSDTLADKTARVSRYITLLERLMALVPMKAGEVLDEVQRAMEMEMRRSYGEAVAAYPLSEKLPGSDTTEVGIQSLTAQQASPQLSNRSNCISNASPATSTEEKSQNLARQIEHVLKSDLPLDVNTIAFVARMVLVAWTLSVETVDWAGQKEGGRGWIRDFEGLGKTVVE